MSLIELCERGYIPDSLTRFGMRRLIGRRLKEELAGTEDTLNARFSATIAELKQSPIALNTKQANEQHYELPTEFFVHVLGPRLKYSSCYWPDAHMSLEQAEEQMLKLTCERAGIVDGESILELGCGWGSLTLWIAEHYPNCKITAVSNSTSQGDYIRATAEQKGFKNVQVITADINDFETPQRFDRVLSIEMFEHMRNYQELLKRIANWLHSGGTLFVHIFCHDKVMYPYTISDEEDWMARYFFTGGLMPAQQTLAHFQDDLKMEDTWRLSGVHYSRTQFAWLERQDKAKQKLIPLFETTYGPDQAERWFQRWRMFFMACGEFFATDGGKQWYVAHYLMRKP